MPTRGLVQGALQRLSVAPPTAGRSPHFLWQNFSLDRPFHAGLLSDRAGARSVHDLRKWLSLTESRCFRRRFQWQCQNVRHGLQRHSFHGSERGWAEGALRNAASKNLPDSNNSPELREDGSSMVVMEGSQNPQRSPDQLCDAVQKLMRQVPQPVAIVTSIDTKSDAAASRDAFRGATISSFNTVTIHPEPVVSFNIKKLSSTFNAIEASGRFWVHFLSSESSAAELADRFTQGNSMDLFKDVQFRSESEHRRHAGEVNVPLIRSLGGSTRDLRSDHVAFILECDYLQKKTVTLGDHVVLFGTVADMHTVADISSCLIYANQGYHVVKLLERPLREHTV